jgi:tryptophan-rich sensory protein
MVKVLLFVATLFVSQIICSARNETAALSCCPKVNAAEQLCNVNPYRYSYCRAAATCDTTTNSCSGRVKFALLTTIDSSPVLYGYSKPISVPPEHLITFFMGWIYCVTAIGLAMIIWQQNNQPMRSRNIYLNVVELISQLMHIRILVGQQESDPCFLTASLTIVCLSANKFALLAQVRIYNVH